MGYKHVGYTGSVDGLVSAIFSDIRHELIEVSVCASTVRVSSKSIEGAFVQRDANTDELWKVYLDGNHIAGTQTINDGFTVARVAKEIELKMSDTAEAV